MDPETLAHIFEPFFTTKEQGKGTGLGLATVYGVVKQSNGYIWVDSALGQGSSFQIYLPRYEGETTETAQKSAPTEKLAGSEHILLVEDADPLRKLIKTFLEAAGFEVVAAQSGAQALALAAAHPKNFDLLITDVVMPGMNGRVLAEQLMNRYPGLPVLYISGYTDSFASGHNVLEQGTHLLHKPFTEEVLIAKAREVLDGARAPAKPAPEAKDIAPSKVN
jgi:CheY-like chemotaxis protein